VLKLDAITGAARAAVSVSSWPDRKSKNDAVLLPEKKGENRTGIVGELVVDRMLDSAYARRERHRVCRNRRTRVDLRAWVWQVAVRRRGQGQGKRRCRGGRGWKSWRARAGIVMLSSVRTTAPLSRRSPPFKPSHTPAGTALSTCSHSNSEYSSASCLYCERQALVRRTPAEPFGVRLAPLALQPPLPRPDASIPPKRKLTLPRTPSGTAPCRQPRPPTATVIFSPSTPVFSRFDTRRPSGRNR
jgi:hypothetical protein